MSDFGQTSRIAASSETTSNSARAEASQLTLSFALARSPAVVGLVLLNIAIFLVLPIAFRGDYPPRLDKLGADWGPLTLSGQWWRLLTSVFVHIELSHLVFNMFGLWVLGKRLERLLGSWTFLLFYLICAFVGDMTVLALRPEGASYGASVGVMGIAGAIVATYSTQILELSWSTRSKLGILILYVGYVVMPEFLERPICWSHCRLVGGRMPCSCFQSLRQNRAKQILDVRRDSVAVDDRRLAHSPSLRFCLNDE
jgi:membrane associated rhomboid family serine protease